MRTLRYRCMPVHWRTSRRLTDAARATRAQVYKALRGGVQDVAVKYLHRTSDEDINRFVEVLLQLQQFAISL